ncbi:MAG: hypothetical protein A3D92_22645 [Bacteroidetes bacterium RIFCSPHIGHO2_02_FULL_44_7]|nr:MAG: hypothetical protein A3D92_22645 [Bacteroidetes bacterium RIFCSPHIGHO2_02_FULL_44_7]
MRKGLQKYEWQELPKTIRSRAEARELITALKELDASEQRPSMIYVYWHFWRIIEIDAIAEDGAMQKYFFNGSKADYYELTAEDARQQVKEMSNLFIPSPTVDRSNCSTEHDKLLLGWEIFLEFEPSWEREIDLWGKMISDTTARILVLGAAAYTPLVKVVEIHVETEELERESYLKPEEIDLSEYVQLNYW